METTTKTRLSHWQVRAAKKYPKLYFCGGDGGEYECFVVLTKCPHEQTRHWRYVLNPTREDAEATLEKWAKERCGYQCQGASAHQMWKLL
jgi:hypothetical protein